MKKLSIMITCYNDENNLSDFCDSLFSILKKVSRKYEAEIMFIDNGSTDDTLNIIKKIVSKDPRCNYISVIRRISKATTMFIGLKNLDVDYIFFMDSKHTKLLPLINKMIYALEREDYDVCSCKIPSPTTFIYDLINLSTGIEIEPGELGFKVITKRTAESIVSSMEFSKIENGTFNWNEFDTKWVECDDSESLEEEIRISEDNLIEYIQKVKPLIISTIVGVIMIGISVLFLCLTVIRRILWQYDPNAVVLIISVIILIGGINLLLISVLIKGLFKSFTDSHNTPIYVIKESSIKNIK